MIAIILILGIIFGTGYTLIHHHDKSKKERFEDFKVNSTVISQKLRDIIEVIKAEYNKERSGLNRDFWSLIDIPYTTLSDGSTIAEAYLIYNQGRDNYFMIYKEEPVVKFATHYHAGKLTYSTPINEEKFKFILFLTTHEDIINQIEEAIDMVKNQVRETNTRETFERLKEGLIRKL
jgi:hypothetical protein